MAAHKLARLRMKARYQGTFKPFKEGDEVWLESKNLSTPYVSKKMAPKREGPFKIKEVLSPFTYRLDLPDRWKIHNVFHASLLTPFTQTEAYGPAFANPPPEEVEGEEEYEVEKILAHRRVGRTSKYLVRWKGYSSYHDSWQSEEDLANCQELLTEFKKTNKGTSKKRNQARK